MIWINLKNCVSEVLIIKSDAKTINEFLEGKRYLAVDDESILSDESYDLWVEDLRNDWLYDFGDSATDMPSDELLLEWANAFKVDIFKDYDNIHSKVHCDMQRTGENHGVEYLIINQVRYEE